MLWKRNVFTRPFLFLFFILIHVAPSGAFNFTRDFQSGSYWPAFPIVFEVRSQENYDQGRLQEAFTQAMDSWESAGGIDIWMTANNGIPETSNLVRWEDDFESVTGHDPSYTLAVAIRHTQNGIWVKTEIILNPNGPRVWNYDNLVAVLTHELGHTIGIGHSRAPQALMNEYLGDHVIHSDDQLALSEVLRLHEERRANRNQSIGFLSGESSNGSTGGGCGLIKNTPSQNKNLIHKYKGFGAFLSVFLMIFLLLISRRKNAIVLT